MIVEIAPQSVVTYCRSVLGIEAGSGGIDDVLLSGLLRRCAGMLCPCSRTVLRTVLVESLSCLHPDSDALPDTLDKLVDDMIVVGDLLELSEVATDDPNVKGTWVFAAPPGFVIRKSGSVFLTGIVPDQDSFLPESLGARIVYSRTTRLIIPEIGENIAEALTAQGLHQFPEAAWLKSPKLQPPEQLLEMFKRKLSAAPTCGPIKGLQILDPSTKVTYYRGRWGEPKKHTGAFVARRPQEFGAPIWSFVELAEGDCQRVIDLPLESYRWRGCDAAWHLQMAIDYCGKQPQRYRRRGTDTGIRFDFYSPLPLWAQRRLMVLGQECPRENSLFAYEISFAEAEEEERYLQQNLWLMLADGNDGGEGG